MRNSLPAPKKNAPKESLSENPITLTFRLKMMSCLLFSWGGERWEQFEIGLFSSTTRDAQLQRISRWRPHFAFLHQMAADFGKLARFYKQNVNGHFWASTAALQDSVNGSLSCRIFKIWILLFIFLFNVCPWKQTSLLITSSPRFTT